jgi:hypothetical protein
MSEQKSQFSFAKESGLFATHAANTPFSYWFTSISTTSATAKERFSTSWPVRLDRDDERIQHGIDSPRWQ